MARHSSQQTSTHGHSSTQNGETTARNRHKGSAGFPHGNYPNYYGYRHQPTSPLDPRLIYVPLDWIQGRRVLDVGCNSGAVTLDLARFYHPHAIQGIDVDPALIRRARISVRQTYSQHSPHVQDWSSVRADQSQELTTAYFPVSCARMFGCFPILSRPFPLLDVESSSGIVDVAAAVTSTEDTEMEGEVGLTYVHHGDALPQIRSISNITTFPHNISFRCGNWVEEPLLAPEERVHIILALSVTKWIHLNSGDAGLKYFFTKCYHALLPGGLLLLEPQTWEGYKKRSQLTPKMKEHFAQIKLFPAMFIEYLTSAAVGFRRVECLVSPAAHPQPKGFDKRSLYALWK